MNKKEFSIYLHKPHLIDKHAEIALQEVVTDFPYFQAAQQLLLKAHQNNGSYHFDRQLPIASLLHGNRALLYAYLKDSLIREFEYVAQNDLVSAEETLNEIINPPLYAPVIEEVENKVAETVIAPSIEDIAPEVFEIIAKTESVTNDEPIETDAAIEDIIESVELPEPVNTDITLETIPSPEPEQEEIDTGAETLTESVETTPSYNFDPSDLPFQNFEEKYLGKKGPESEENLLTPESWVVPVLENEESIIKDEQVFEEAGVEVNLDEEIAPEIIEPPVVLETRVMMPVEEKKESGSEEPLTREESKVISTIEPHDFLTWLQAKKSNVTPSPKPVDKLETISPPEIDESVNLTESEKDKVENKEGGEKRIKKFNALIDKFIETSPSITKPKPTKFYNPAEKARESVTENFDLVTETLAKIYIKQNNYKKAILVYEKLSLLHPEKMSYFAAQISELQILLNK